MGITEKRIREIARETKRLTGKKKLYVFPSGQSSFHAYGDECPLTSFSIPETVAVVTDAIRLAEIAEEEMLEKENGNQ
jgi:hypothetical protein